MSRSYQETIDNKSSQTVTGCLRGALGFCVSLSGSIFVGIMTGIKAGVWLGIVSAAGVFIVLISISVYLMNTAKKLTLVDCLLPLPLGVISAVAFAPVGLTLGSVFSPVTCLMSALFLTVMLFMYRAGRISGGWLIMPFLVFVYEMLPIELPTDIDNALAFGGNLTNTAAAVLTTNTRRFFLKDDSYSD